MFTVNSGKPQTDPCMVIVYSSCMWVWTIGYPKFTETHTYNIFESAWKSKPSYIHSKYLTTWLQLGIAHGRQGAKSCYSTQPSANWAVEMCKELWCGLEWRGHTMKHLRQHEPIIWFYFIPYYTMDGLGSIIMENIHMWKRCALSPFVLNHGADPRGPKQVISMTCRT